MAKKKGTTKKNIDDDISTEKAKAADKQAPAKTSFEEEEEKEDELICCCLCYNAVDYSDKSYFCQEARDSDSDLEGGQPVLLPAELYDPHNALVFCDGCDRPYHQRCHFVPTIHLPRGDWHCFICTTTPKLLESNKSTGTPTKTTPKGKKKSPKAKKKNDTVALPAWTRKQLKSELYQMDKPAGALEQRWEHAVGQYKLTGTKQEVRRLKGALSVQMQNIRLAQMAMKALTTSSSRRQSNSIETLLKSQELCQTLVKLSSAKLRVRLLLQSLEAYRKGDDTSWGVLQSFLEKNPKERQAWFPFLLNAARRMPPRLKDEEDSNNDTDDKVVPKEIHLDKSCSKKGEKSKRASKTASKKGKASKPVATAKDDDSGISLDDLKCCVCFKGEATDDNDLLLCDGQGCFRAHHMHCLVPIMTQELTEEAEDWFCPLCSTIAKMVADVQSEFTGDEWYSEDMGESVASWEQVDDVFPESPVEYEMAMKWKENKMDKATKTYLKDLFGGDDGDAAEYEHGDEGILGDEEEDDEDDDFEPDKAKKRKDKGDDNDDDDASSNASLDEISMVELNIGRCELAALSGGEQSSDDEDEDDDDENDDGKSKQKSSGKARRFRRIRSTRTSRANTDNESSDNDEAPAPPKDIGKLDEANIVRGKRRRRRIDYRVLNDSMFGKLSSKDKEKIDDTDDFQYKRKSKDTTSESESSNSGSSSEDEDDDNSDEDNEDEQEEEQEENEGATSKEEVSLASEGKAATKMKSIAKKQPTNAKRPEQKKRKTK